MAHRSRAEPLRRSNDACVAPTTCCAAPPPKKCGSAVKKKKVFSSAFWLTSFIPTITTPLVAAAHAKGDREAVRRHVGGAIFFSALLGLFLTVALASNLGGRALAAVRRASRARRSARARVCLRDA